MKIAIIGYGKMGKMIESIAVDRGHKIGSKIDIDNQDLMAAENLKKHDVVIEFTRPETAADNISRCLDAGIPVVSGTTGWKDKLGELVNRCKKENTAFLYASNFSLGVNLLFHLNRQMASIMNRYQEYDVRLSEIHHIQKLDAPSGTAITLADDILENISRKKGWTMEEPPIPGSEKIWIDCIRAGNVAGVHEISYESGSDLLSIRHAAKDRRGFALGAVLAAEFISDKTGFFTMKEVLNL